MENAKTQIHQIIGLVDKLSELSTKSNTPGEEPANPVDGQSWLKIVSTNID